MTIKRIDGKETNQYTLAEYEVALINTPDMKQGRIGEIIVDIGGNPSFPSLWVANVDGYLNQINGGGGGSFSTFVVNGIPITGSSSPAIGMDSQQIVISGENVTTVGLEVVQSAGSNIGSIQFRVTPTGIPVDNPFSANFDMSGGMPLGPAYETLGDEVNVQWIWDLSKNPLASLQTIDLGLLP